MSHSAGDWYMISKTVVLDDLQGSSGAGADTGAKDNLGGYPVDGRQDVIDVTGAPQRAIVSRCLLLERANHR